MNEELVQDIKDIKERVEKTFNTITEMQRQEAARVERELQMKNDVDNLKKTVNGNGIPGLKTDVQLLKEQMTRIYWLGGIVVVALVGNIIAMWFEK